MNLVIFDIDGTLIQSTGVDDQCLTSAFSRVYGLDLPALDWGDFLHSTDQGLSIEVCERWGGRTPQSAEIEIVKRAFVELLQDAIAAEPGRCVPVTGVHAMLHTLKASKEWVVGLASGAWAESAAVKLAAAGVSTIGLPATFSHAHADGRPALREEIIEATVSRLVAERLEGNASEVERVVYVGDGVWDARAARNLGIGFVGMRHDRQEARLRAEGASAVLHDYADQDRVIQLLERAASPESSASAQAGPQARLG